jgi:hypothetical protein
MYDLYLKYIKRIFPNIKNIYFFMFMLNVLVGYILARLNYSFILSIMIDLLLINIVEIKLVQKYVESMGLSEAIEMKKSLIDDFISNKFIITKDLAGISLGWILGNMKK